MQHWNTELYWLQTLYFPIAWLFAVEAIIIRYEIETAHIRYETE